MKSSVRAHTLKIETSGIEMHLHPSGAVYWPSAECLLLSDLHLGKEAVFQQSGIAIPSGASSATLHSMRSLVEDFSPRQVIVLGDLLHSKVGLTPLLAEELRSTIHRFADSQWILIPGNHDRGGLQALRNCGWSIASDCMKTQGVELMHAPGNTSAVARFTISGHLHPSIRIALNSKETARLRCYWLSQSQMILPAFGGWTGTQSISPSKEDRIFLCVEKEVIELSR